ncbi:Multidrug resistance efflux transporter EmrE [Pseudohyphozyma bogoriensis]|nr:Multidrug resistance efflux transporter EmrE [Pseudohyphozyma bogoriensis]
MEYAKKAAATLTAKAEYEPIQLDELDGAHPAEDKALLTDDENAQVPDATGAGAAPEQQREWQRGSVVVPMSPGMSMARKPAGENDEQNGSRAAFFFWIAVNCLATLGIVLANKQILSNPTLRGAPTLFVAYHFFLTSVTLHVASSGLVGAFERKSAPILALLPLAFVFAGHTVVTNWSLALLEVAIYQEIRILVTPATVLINFIAYRKTVSFQSLLALAVVCAGISLTVYSDTLQKQALAAQIKHAAPAMLMKRVEKLHAMKNTPLGYMFGMAGVFLSALYTMLQVSSMQLLHLQAPLGCALLLICTPFLDTLPIWSNITSWEFTLLIASGLCAVLINISQFFIVAQSSALSSTVVGHGKTCLVVAVGWMTATSAISLGSGVGIFFAIIGIVGYSAITMSQKK